MKQKEYTSIPENVALYVLDRDVYCFNPRCRDRYTDALQIHHIVSRGRHGSGSDPCNLVVLCWKCHSQIDRLKKIIPELFELDVVSEKDLIHRVQLPFYDHNFKENEIICFHAKRN